MLSATEKGVLDPSQEANTFVEHVAITDEPLNRNSPDEPYKMSWRTIGGFLALSLAWSGSSFGITGPNSSIGYMVADYPDQAHNASWIASAPLFCLVALPGLLGASSDRYGKKWFLMAGGLIAMVGALVEAFATSINMIIGGSALTGIGGSALILAVAAGMEIVPAKYRTLEAALMAIINGSLGIIGGVAICKSSLGLGASRRETNTGTVSACVQHGLGWRWGFKIQAILYGVGVVANGLFYHPPPTRLRKQQTLTAMLKSIDFIGIALLSCGAVLLTIPLIWGGSLYAWNSARVIPFLILGPVLLIVFSIYGESKPIPGERPLTNTPLLPSRAEWKGRSDGILHHDFFVLRSFPVLLVFGFVDGMILYGTSVFIPDQSRGVYYSEPLSVARGLITFSGLLLAGFLFFGWVTTKLKQFRLPLVVASGTLALFCGLITRATASNAAYYEGMLAAIGFWTAGTEIIPVGAIGLIVPSHLIATSNMVLATCRGLGGAVAIAIFSAVYGNKAATNISNNVVPVLAKAGVPTQDYPTIIGIVVNNPAALAKVPGLSAGTIVDIVTAARVGAAESYRYVWFCILAVALGQFLLTFFVVDAPDRMDNHVEAALERVPTNVTVCKGMEA